MTPDAEGRTTEGRTIDGTTIGGTTTDGRAAYDAVVSDVLQGMRSAAATFGADGKLRTANAAARAQLVIDPLAPLASQSATVVLSTLGDDVLRLVQYALDTGERDERSIRVRVDDRWLYVRVVGLNAQHLMLTICDVTRRESTRESLERAERELGAVFELTPSSVHVADAAGRILRRNSNASAAYGAPLPETIRALWELDRPTRPENDGALTFVEHAAMRALAGQTVQHELVRVRRREQAEPRLVEWNAAPMRDEQGRVTGVVLMELDLSAQPLAQLLEREVANGVEVDARVRSEAERIERIVEERAKALASRDDAMARDRRLAAIGQLAADVMHDVNNALNPIMAAAYLLRHHAESPDAVRDYADRIKKAAETGAATASRVGRFIRQEPLHAGNEETLDLSALTDEVLELTAPMRQRHPGSGSEVRVVRDYTPGAQTRGTPGEIREALLNLVSNATDAMPTGGTLTVRTQVDGDAALVVVQDDGVGMSAEVQERAFEPFFSTKGAGGSGLGLAEVYGIVRRHRGSVTINSAPGAGTSVTLRFPREQVAAPPTPIEATPQRSEPLHILVVEDHEDGREFLRRLLRSGGHTVDAVGTCADARERLASATSTAYHLLLTDVGLPDGSGWDLVQFVRERLPSLRVGVITGWEPMVSSSESAGAEFVLRKPIRAAELLAHIAGHKAPALPE